MSQETQAINMQQKISNDNKSMVGFFAEKKNRLWAIIMALTVGIIFAAAIIGHEPGINVFILTCAMVAFAGWAIYRDGNLHVGRFAFWAAVFLSASSVFFRLASQAYWVFAILIIPPLFVVVTIFSSNKLPGHIVVNALIRFFGSIAFVDKIFVALNSLSKGGDGKKDGALKIVVGVAISIVLLLMIVPLMFSADSVFKKVVADIINLDSIFEYLWKTVLACAAAILFFGFLYIITVKKNTPETEARSLKKAYNVESTLMVVLIMVGVVYSAFSVIQFSHLFGGIKSGVPEGVSVTEYARSGYFEQVFLTVINLAIIGVSVFLTDLTSGKKKSVINSMLLYFIAINIYLMISSAYKMGKYQNMYGFTVLRLTVDILLIFEALIFIVLIVKILKRSLPCLMYMLYFAAAFWAAVSFVNIEGMSADLNIKRFEQGKEIDIEYLMWMQDVSPQLKYLYVEHYDDLAKGDIENIEDYFLNNARNDIRYSGPSSSKYDRALKFNLSKYRREKDAYEVLRIKNMR